MNTLLLILLLGWSIEIPSSKVADSPGAELLNRSDSPHRGGAILPDTFLKYPNGAEVSMLPLHSSGLSTVDGGPILRPPVFSLPSQIDFGLVDQHLDPGAGEGSSSLQPAPVTVSAPNYKTATSLSGAPRSEDNRQLSAVTDPTPQLSLELSGDEGSKLAPDSRGPSTVDRGPKYETASLPTSTSATAGRRSDVSSLASCVLHLASSTPAPPESYQDPVTVTDTLKIPNAYIYGEVVSFTPNDTAYITVWQRFIHEKQWNPAPVQKKFPLQIGNLFEGSYGKRVFELSLPVDDSVSVFSLSLDRYPILENYLLEAGDSIKVLIDLRKGQTLFVGPTGAKYQAQHLIYQLLEATRQDQNPVMVSTPAGVERMVASNTEMYQKAIHQTSSLRKSLRFIQTRADSLHQLSSQKVDFSFQHPAWALYESQKQIMGAQFAQIIPSRIVGHQLLPFFRSARSYADLGQPVFEQLPTQVASLLQVQERYGWDARAPELIELLLHERYLMALQENTKLFPQFDQIDSDIRDRLYARYLISNIEHRAMSQEAFEHAANTVTTPWIRELITQMQKHLVVGADLSSHTFIGFEGNPVAIKDFEGKLVLISFWLSGCVYSEAEFEKVILPTQEHFKDNEEVVFLSASADPRHSVWKSTVESGELTSEYSLSVYAGPENPMIRGMGIRSYPRKVLLDTAGRLLGFQELPRNAEDLIRLIEQKLTSVHPTITHIQ
ncbi:TlpA family protein disulfide reductase [Algoriphagus boritolerans]|nr:hypothetical protein [Algoriphagus boritolerans]